MPETEKIELQTIVKGTEIVNFFGLDSPDFSGLTFGYLIVDVANNPVKITTNSFDTQFSRQNVTNNFVYDTSINFITGWTVSTILNYEIPSAQQGAINQRFVTKNKNTYGQQYTFFSEFRETSVNDLHANISIHRTFDILDTLSVINSVDGEPVYRESPTGVLYGKIQSLQKINDEFGNKLTIPLVQVPVCVFNTSTAFPDISSLDDNGNRIVLNIKENSFSNQYFDQETYNFAQDFLSSTQSLKLIPDQYKYTAITNENGEFVIYDVPIGSQSFMLEIDLLKHGLTKDEVSLSMFPYPTVSSPTVDTVPHFYFRQFNINIVPSWGDYQSGYTELNISVPIDLRKWTNYVFPPVAFVADEKLETTVAKNSSKKLKVQIRDMTAPNFDFKTLTLSKVQDDLDRDTGAQYVWYNSFAENRRNVDFNQFGCNIIKLPANMYDPNGFQTDENGIPTTRKGVWLSSYQFREYIDDGFLSSRATGGYSYWLNGKYYLISHFDLNYIDGNDITYSSYPSSATTNQFPYEKPWTINYPEPYSITKKPVNIRFTGMTDRQIFSSGATAADNVYYMDEPAYSDGDLVGMETSTPGSISNSTGGFGVQYIPDISGNASILFFANRISEVATKNFMYKYERNVAWNETYSNGFEPFWDTPSQKQIFGGKSKVNGNERFQRLEAGYGYFMKPQGWPRYVKTDIGDIPSADILLNPTTVSSSPFTLVPGIIGKNMYSAKYWPNDTFNINKQDLALSLGTGNQVKNGTIDIYRIVHSGQDYINIPYNFVIPTYANLVIHSAILAYSFSLTNTGEIPSSIKNTYHQPVYYYDLNNVVRLANIGEMIILYPNHRLFLDAYGVSNEWGYSDLALGGSLVSLPGNSNYSNDLNQYTVSSYSFGATYKNSVDVGESYGNPGHFSTDISIGVGLNVYNYYIITETTGKNNGAWNDGIDSYFSESNLSKYKITKMLYIANDLSTNGSYGEFI